MWRIMSTWQIPIGIIIRIVIQIQIIPMAITSQEMVHHKRSQLAALLESIPPTIPVPVPVRAEDFNCLRPGQRCRRNSNCGARTACAGWEVKPWGIQRRQDPQALHRMPAPTPERPTSTQSTMWRTAAKVSPKPMAPLPHGHCQRGRGRNVNGSRTSKAISWRKYSRGSANVKVFILFTLL